MRWMEIITLRTADTKGKQAAQDLLAQVDRPGADTRQQGFKLYHNAEVETDLSIHIEWNSETNGQGKSPLGVELAHALKGFGLVNHSVWIEEK